MPMTISKKRYKADASGKLHRVPTNLLESMDLPTEALLPGAMGSVDQIREAVGKLLTAAMTMTGDARAVGTEIIRIGQLLLKNLDTGKDPAVTESYMGELRGLLESRDPAVFINSRAPANLERFRRPSFSGVSWYITESVQISEQPTGALLEAQARRRVNGGNESERDELPESNEGYQQFVESLACATSTQRPTLKDMALPDSPSAGARFEQQRSRVFGGRDAEPFIRATAKLEGDDATDSRPNELMEALRE